MKGKSKAGLLLGVGLFIVAYLAVSITVLSISAIATNGVVKGGGAYYMISRTLGPEFGGAIGIIFFFANVFASALYVLGFVEALLNNFGPRGSLAHIESFHQGYWYQFLYGSAILMLCLAVCMIGAGMFAKTSFVIFLAVMVSVSAALISFIIHDRNDELHPASANPLSHNKSIRFSYTGWSFKTAKSNLWPKFTKDYTKDEHSEQTWLQVFAILFNGVTGIMAGANMSGDLKSPGKAIPYGTLTACLGTFVVYVILVICTGFTCSRELLVENYNYLQVIDNVRVLITIGVFASTLSAALSCLIGASRILHAIAKDQLLGVILKPFAAGFGRNNEPLNAVLLSWFFVEIILFIGNLNTVAPLVSMFFLLCYGVTNMACFVLKVASAPNFRPTFKYFSWQTAFLGTVFCFVIMFAINPLYATISIAVMFILFIIISLRAPPTPWGDVSQALIYHQVRKYLLRLDVRKEHVKFWRPQVLLLVSNPRSSYNLIDFVNDIKKSGLYILGHVQVGEFNSDSICQQKNDTGTWLNFVDCAEIKSFVELTIASSIRQGVQHLLLTSGLGGMRPNTVFLGFFDHSIPKDSLARGVHRRTKTFLNRAEKERQFIQAQADLPRLRVSPEDQTMTLHDYVGVIKDAMHIGKNVCVTRNFENLHKSAITEGSYIDVWPVNASAVKEGMLLGPYDFTYLLILQLSCVLHMVPFWEKKTTLRVMTVIGENEVAEEESLKRLLRELRIPAEVHMIRASDEEPRTRNADGLNPAINWYKSVNQLIRLHSSEACVVFTGLPHPAIDDNMVEQFIQELDILSANLPPVVMVYGRSPVVYTSL
ncbi:solute carrier family 12 member 9 isoform X2 [Nematostella vectensis]|uniref:solute carrier family 12 member 9 isoform X2 n=1 Tax=Nematostella vectensis TaxID=45351 RepID=UPI0020772128|nr:solute carrier family 12 member 9 isoform X2 [Nematostella vectensis]